MQPAIRDNDIITQMVTNGVARLWSWGYATITTNWAFNPDDGWKLLEIIEGGSPGACGSVGFIVVCEK